MEQEGIYLGLRAAQHPDGCAPPRDVLDIVHGSVLLGRVGGSECVRSTEVRRAALRHTMGPEISIINDYKQAPLPGTD